MDIVISFDFIQDFFSLPIDEIAKRFLLYFGWIPFAIVFLWGALQLWIFHIQGKWAEKNSKHTLLAIDVPKGNEQSPKAVENLFSYLAGAHGSINLIEKYWEGKFQLSFSFEIISVDGYTQFLIRTPIVFRNLVESAVYAQYPDAEITEVDDYTSEFADLRFPDDTYDIWGSEFMLTETPALPIKTYEEFEHQMGAPETHFKDPMAALMDLTSSLRKGEQLWYQIILIPTGFDWIKTCDNEVSKILGEKTGGNNIFGKMADGVLGVISTFGQSITGSVSEETVAKKEDDPLKMINLKPKQKKRVEGIEAKTAHFAFDFKIRMVYLAKKDIFQKAKAVSGFVGYMKQFSALDMNSFKPDMSVTATTASYLFTKSRLNKKKNSIFRNYISRDGWAGRAPGFLNVVELATIWHFPHEGVVKAPLIQKAPGKKAEPPMMLPQSDEIVSEKVYEPLFLDEGGEDLKKESEDNIFDEEIVEKKPQKQNDLNDNIFIENEEDEIIPPSNLPIA